MKFLSHLRNAYKLTNVAQKNSLNHASSAVGPDQLQVRNYVSKSSDSKIAISFQEQKGNISNLFHGKFKGKDSFQDTFAKLLLLRDFGPHVQIFPEKYEPKALNPNLLQNCDDTTNNSEFPCEETIGLRFDNNLQKNTTNVPVPFAEVCLRQNSNVETPLPELPFEVYSESVAPESLTLNKFNPESSPVNLKQPSLNDYIATISATLCNTSMKSDLARNTYSKDYSTDRTWKEIDKKLIEKCDKTKNENLKLKNSKQFEDKLKGYDYFRNKLEARSFQTSSQKYEGSKERKRSPYIVCVREGEKGCTSPGLVDNPPYIPKNMQETKAENESPKVLNSFNLLDVQLYKKALKDAELKRKLATSMCAEEIPKNKTALENNCKSEITDTTSNILSKRNEKKTVSAKTCQKPKSDSYESCRKPSKISLTDARSLSFKSSVEPPNIKSKNPVKIVTNSKCKSQNSGDSNKPNGKNPINNNSAGEEESASGFNLTSEMISSDNLPFKVPLPDCVRTQTSPKTIPKTTISECKSQVPNDKSKKSPSTCEIKSDETCESVKNPPNCGSKSSSSKDKETKSSCGSKTDSNQTCQKMPCKSKSCSESTNSNSNKSSPCSNSCEKEPTDCESKKYESLSSTEKSTTTDPCSDKKPKPKCKRPPSGDTKPRCKQPDSKCGSNKGSEPKSKQPCISKCGPKKEHKPKCSSEATQHKNSANSKPPKRDAYTLSRANPAKIGFPIYNYLASRNFSDKCKGPKKSYTPSSKRSEEYRKETCENFSWEDSRKRRKLPRKNKNCYPDETQEFCPDSACYGVYETKRGKTNKKKGPKENKKRNSKGALFTTGSNYFKNYLLSASFYDIPKYFSSSNITGNEEVCIESPYKISTRIQSDPVLTANDVFLSIDSVAISDSDIYLFETGGRHYSELTIGNEATGIIRMVGKNVDNLKIGDHVVLESGIPCSKCQLCKTGHYNLCSQLSFKGFLRKCCSHPASFCHKISRVIPLEYAALTNQLALGCNACCQGGIKPNSNVAIIGSCAVAVCAAMCAQSIGAANVCFISSLKKAQNIVKEFITDNVIDFDSKTKEKAIVEEICETMGTFPDVIINFSCCTKTMNTAMMALKPNGTCVIAGFFEECVSFNIMDALMKEIRIMPSFRSKNMFPLAISLLETGRAPVERLIATCCKWDQIECAFQRALSEGNNGPMKVIVQCDESSGIKLLNDQIIF